MYLLSAWNTLKPHSEFDKLMSVKNKVCFLRKPAIASKKSFVFHIDSFLCTRLFFPVWMSAVFVCTNYIFENICGNSFTLSIYSSMLLFWSVQIYTCMCNFMCILYALPYTMQSPILCIHQCTPLYISVELWSFSMGARRRGAKGLRRPAPLRYEACAEIWREREPHGKECDIHIAATLGFEQIISYEYLKKCIISYVKQDQNVFTTRRGPHVCQLERECKSTQKALWICKFRYICFTPICMCILVLGVFDIAIQQRLTSRSWGAGWCECGSPWQGPGKRFRPPPWSPWGPGL